MNSARLVFLRSVLELVDVHTAAWATEFQAHIQEEILRVVAVDAARHLHPVAMPEAAIFKAVACKQPLQSDGEPEVFGVVVFKPEQRRSS